MSQEQNRSLIKAAAVRLLRRSRELHVRELAAEAGLSTGTVYNAFPTLDHLVLEVISESWDELVTEVESSPSESLGTLMQKWLDRTEVRNLVTSAHKHPAARRPVIQGEARCTSLESLRDVVEVRLEDVFPDATQRERYRVALAVVALFRFVQMELGQNSDLICTECSMTVPLFNYIIRRMAGEK